MTSIKDAKRKRRNATKSRRNNKDRNNNDNDENIPYMEPNSVEWVVSLIRNQLVNIIVKNF